MLRFQSAPYSLYKVSLKINFDQKRLSVDTLFGNLLCIGVYISIDMHFIKIVVDLITLYLSTNFTNNPRIYQPIV